MADQLFPTDRRFPVTTLSRSASNAFEFPEMIIRWFIAGYVGLFAWGLVFMGTFALSIEIMSQLGMGSLTGNSFHVNKEANQNVPLILLADAIVSAALVWLAGALYFVPKKKAALRKARQEAECEIDGVGFK